MTGGGYQRDNNQRPTSKKRNYSNHKQQRQRHQHDDQEEEYAVDDLLIAASYAAAAIVPSIPLPATTTAAVAPLTTQSDNDDNDNGDNDEIDIDSVTESVASSSSEKVKADVIDSHHHDVNTTTNLAKSDEKINDEDHEEGEADNDDDESDVDLTEQLARMIDDEDEEDDDDACLLSSNKKNSVNNIPKTANEVDAYHTDLQQLETVMQLSLQVSSSTTIPTTPTIPATKNVFDEQPQHVVDFDLTTMMLKPAGYILHYMVDDRTIIIQSDGAGGIILDEGTILFLVFDNNTPVPIGKIFEVFGPIRQPLYSIRLPQKVPNNSDPQTNVNSLSSQSPSKKNHNKKHQRSTKKKNNSKTKPSSNLTDLKNSEIDSPSVLDDVSKLTCKPEEKLNESVDGVATGDKLPSSTAGVDATPDVIIIENVQSEQEVAVSLPNNMKNDIEQDEEKKTITEEFPIELYPDDTTSTTNHNHNTSNNEISAATEKRNENDTSTATALPESLLNDDNNMVRDTINNNLASNVCSDHQSHINPNQKVDASVLTVPQMIVNEENSTKEKVKPLFVDPWSREDGEYGKFILSKLQRKETITVHYIPNDSNYHETAVTSVKTASGTRILDTASIIRNNRRGCDASNVYDEEIVNVYEMDFSDDEQERSAKSSNKKHSNNHRNNNNNEECQQQQQGFTSRNNSGDDHHGVRKDFTRNYGVRGRGLGRGGGTLHNHNRPGRLGQHDQTAGLHGSRHNNYPLMPPPIGFQNNYFQTPDGLFQLHQGVPSNSGYYPPPLSGPMGSTAAVGTHNDTLGQQQRQQQHPNISGFGIHQPHQQQHSPVYSTYTPGVIHPPPPPPPPPPTAHPKQADEEECDTVYYDY